MNEAAAVSGPGEVDVTQGLFPLSPGATWTAASPEHPDERTARIGRENVKHAHELRMEFVKLWAALLLYALTVIAVLILATVMWKAHPDQQPTVALCQTLLVAVLTGVGSFIAGQGVSPRK